jgi:hypothetical protein
MTQAPPSTHQPVLKPHRGAMVLTLGIVSLVFSTACGFIVGIIAWVMGSADLREMDAGRMDPTGRGLTQAGKICGIISVVIGVAALVIALLWIILVVVIGGAAAAAGAAGGGGP